MSSPAPGGSRLGRGSGITLLPAGLADFARRGFRLDRPADRQILETHARYFLTGFNLAVGHWRSPHEVLGEVPDHERGFAYEGAGMHAALRDIVTARQSGAFATLLAGPGRAYVHLVHVGYGWAMAPFGLPLRIRLPDTPLLRWLALDGVGFARAYFGGLRALRRQCRPRTSETWQARVAGCGRALWFLQSADTNGIATVIGRAPAAARPHLWSGIGLASCYAGCADQVGSIDELATASGQFWPHLGQGALFGVAARLRAGNVPPHTELTCHRLFGVDPDEAARWTDDAAGGLMGTGDISAYTEWKKRLRRKLTSTVM